MRLVMVGGGGFRTPLVYAALLRAEAANPVRTVVLYDADRSRLALMSTLLAEQARDRPEAPQVEVSTDLPSALAGADVVFSAIRVGGLSGRVADERVALDLGVLGQETTGPGGLSFGLRTVPVARALAEAISSYCPTAWVINFTNPAGLITETMRAVLGDRVVGICDSPIGLVRRCARALGRSVDELTIDYAGLNHLGWLRGLSDVEGDLLPGLIADRAALASFEEGRLFGADWIATLGLVPNEYLYYWYFTREAVDGIRSGGPTRGEMVAEQQRAFYATAGAAPRGVHDTWEAVRRERDASYLQESRPAGAARDEQDIAGGGYEDVALDIVRAVAHDRPATLILNVANAGLLPGLDDDAVVEVPCRVDASGPRAQPVSPLVGAELGLVQQVKAVERLVIEAALTGSVPLAERAFALHPLVDSVSVARKLLAGYRATIPEVDRVFRHAS